VLVDRAGVQRRPLSYSVHWHSIFPHSQ
jgi:hypothetical protein